MRALLITAGLFVLAGSAIAAAAKPTGHTLRKSKGGPIVALAQDGRDAAWITAAAKHGVRCNEVHLLSPGKSDRTLPQPESNSMTCRWILQGWPTQLAIAGTMSTALWTLHSSQGAPFDQIVAASFNGPERPVRRLSRASDGTGDWLVDVAGAGRTLAYSWDDVEYVDKLACLSGGSCKEKVADGGIRVVIREHPGFQDLPLPGAQPALQLAAAAGRIAYVPATMVRGDRPSTGTNNTLDIVNATGDVLGQPFVRGIPIAIALSPKVFAVLTTQSGPRDRVSWFSAAHGTKLGSVLVSAAAAPQLGTSGSLIVYRVGRLLRGISTQNGHIRTLAKTGNGIADFSLSRGRLVWTENHGDDVQSQTGRLRALSVG